MQINLFIGGYLHSNEQLKNIGKKLLYRTSEYSFINESFEEGQGYLIKTYNPTIEDWKKFEHSLDFLHSWKRNYEDDDILDRIQWEFKLKTKIANFKIYGSNKFPHNFQELIKSIQELINDKTAFSFV